MHIASSVLLNLDSKSSFKFSFINNQFLLSFLTPFKVYGDFAALTRIAFLADERMLMFFFSVLSWGLCVIFLCTDKIWGKGRLACMCWAVPCCFHCLCFVSQEAEITELVLLGKGGWVWAVAYRGLSHLPRGLQPGPLWAVTSLGSRQASSGLCDNVNIQKA